jgi:hypothetical protein
LNLAREDEILWEIKEEVKELKASNKALQREVEKLRAEMGA